MNCRVSHRSFLNRPVRSHFPPEATHAPGEAELTRGRMLLTLILLMHTYLLYMDGAAERHAARGGLLLAFCLFKSENSADSQEGRQNRVKE